jgi:hypothetical protein
VASWLYVTQFPPSSLKTKGRISGEGCSCPAQRRLGDTDRAGGTCCVPVPGKGWQGVTNRAPTLPPSTGILPLRFCPLYPVRLLPLQPQLHREPLTLHQLPLPGGAGVHHYAEPQCGESTPQGEQSRGGLGASAAPGWRAGPAVKGR